MSTYTRALISFTFLASLFLAPSPLLAADDAEVLALKEDLAHQIELIKAQQTALDQQREKLAQQEAAIQKHQEKLEALMSSMTDIKNEQKDTIALVKATPLTIKDQREATGTGSGTSIQAPDKEPERPEIPILADAGGVLTPKGTLMYENSLEYMNTTNNIYTFDGVQLAELVFVGVQNTTTAVRQVLQDSHRFRLGLTDRLEADVRIPYVYRNDKSTNTTTNTTTTIEGNGLGDIDVGLAYQFNRGREEWPFFVGNLRYKANNADGPYDVDYDSNNIAEKLPTGTGFQSIEASVSAIKVSDPAVLFANLGYVYNVGKSIDRTFDDTRVIEVDPGNALNASAGMGFSINQDLSFTLGYKHSYVFSTRQASQTVSTGVYSASQSGDTNIGALLVGANYKFSPIASLNMNVEVGATQEAPDVRVGFRIPVKLGDLF